MTIEERGTAIVVEDDDDEGLIMQEILEEAGFASVDMRSEDVLEGEAEMINPSLFIIDLQADDGAAITVARFLREHGFPATPIVMVSSSPHLMETAGDGHIFLDHVDRPYDAELVIERVTRLF